MIPEIIVLSMLMIAILFNLLAVIGLHRFPDVYTRMHAATKCTTFGTLFLGFSVVVYSLVHWYDTGAGIHGSVLARTIVVMVALLLTNPTGAHALSRAAYRSGVKPVGAVVDMLENKEKEE